MPVSLVLAVSALLQLTAALLALRLVQIIGKPAACGIIAAALFLMAVRSALVLFPLLAGTLSHTPDVTEELVTLGLSALMVAGLAWIAPLFVSMKRSQTALQARARQQEAVAELGQYALVGTDLSALFDKAVARVAETLDVEYVKVLELLPDGQELLLRAGVGWKPGYVGHATVGAKARSQAGFTLTTNEPVIVEDLRTEVRFSGPPLLHDHDVISGISVIIAGQEKPFGILGAHTATRRTFTRDDIHFLQAVSNLLAEAIQRKRTEEALRESEERYRRFFEEDLTADFISTPEGRLLACNPAFARIFGFASVEEAIQSNLVALYPNPHARQTFLELLRGKKKLEYYETELRRRDGSPVHVIENVIGTFDEQGELVEMKGYLFDITERKRLEEQLQQSQKMEAIGRLAGGIAHDFNNLLTAIMGYSELFAYELDPKDPRQRFVQEIHKTAQRAASLTRQLLAFSRKQVLQPRVLDLNAALASIEKMLRRVIGEDIDLVTRLSPDLGSVKVDPGQIEQVIMNLSVNARDAMPRGGKLTIETANVDLDDDYARRHVGVTPGAYVMLAVSDTGSGMDPETQSRIFEPFFTTKSHGAGTGLGLSTVYGIVKQSGGHIWLYSEPGRGTTFKIYFPRVEEEAETEQPTPVIPQPTGGSETILLVEDEEVVRDVAHRILLRYGYNVLVAEHGEEALHICETHDGAIHLMITDVVLPQMSGRELADRVTGLRPEMKVLYVSGYTDNAIVHHGVLEPGTAFLGKPFTPDTLAVKVREVLDSES
jgi:PAS domain S-box-containing protein